MQTPTSPTDPAGPRLLVAACVADAAGVAFAPAALLYSHEPVSDGPALIRVHAVGSPAEVRAHPMAAGALECNRTYAVVLPGLVNAHAHLDLTLVGPLPFEPAAGFAGWIDGIRRSRATTDDAVEAAVRLGVASVSAEVAAVGDIAGDAGGTTRIAACRAVRGAPFASVSFIEFFGVGGREPGAFERLQASLGPAGAVASGWHRRVGMQPHAPYTVSAGLYGLAADLASRLGLPICTHLAESPEERRFIARGDGPLQDFLRSLGLWSDAAGRGLGQGHSPVAHLRPALERARFLAVHVNDADDADIEILARTDTRVVYCPRASAYFRAEEHFGPHRYRDMLAAGVPVALGTDSIVNLPASGPDAGRISVLDEMRFLRRRDGTDPWCLLRMATVAGAGALGLDPTLFRFTPGGRTAGAWALDLPAPAAEAGRGSPERLLGEVLASCAIAERLP